MDGGGFEPPKQFAADLQSVPFGHSGIHPYGLHHKADDRTRTDNLLITNQLLCQLSHIGKWAFTQMTPTGIEPVLPPWKGDVLTAWPRSQKTPPVGLEPTTTRLTAECSTDWAKEDYLYEQKTPTMNSQ